MALTPDSLMRARYSAFAKRNIEFLIESHDEQTRQQVNAQELAEWAANAKFLSLQVLNTSENGPKGIVEFVAEIEEASNAYRHHEISVFRKKQGLWYYREGKVKT